MARISTASGEKSESMSEDDPSVGDLPVGGRTTEQVYRALILPRLIEEKKLRLIRQGRLSKWFSGFGQEAIAVGTTLALSENDWILPMHRNLGVWTTRGLPLDRLFCQLMGKSGGFTRGRDRTFHFGLPDRRIVGMISHLAAMLPVADGLALSGRLAGERIVAAAFVGEGATREGDFHEAVNLAAVWKLPVIFIVENNGYGLSTPVGDVIAVEDIARAGAGYGMAASTVDGNNLLDVITAVDRARNRALSGNGPTLLEMKTFRIRGHEEASGTKYVPDELIDWWSERDPVARFEQDIDGELGEDARESIRAEIRNEINKVAEWALDQPPVQSTLEQEVSDVFCGDRDASFYANIAENIENLPGSTISSSISYAKSAEHNAVNEAEASADQTSTKRFIDAVSDGLRAAMREFDETVLLGQDIAQYGGVFKVTAGFLDEFGPERVRNTPIIESGAVGAAMGLALGGHRPILEIQYADFITCGFNQIVNNLATTHYRWGASLNVTIRAPFGGGIGAGPFHSQSIESWFCHVPGLKVVIPSTPEDAKGLLLASIDDPNPVIFLEHKKLYRSLTGSVPNGAYRIPLGPARLARRGADATVVTWGIGVHWALEEAERRSHRGQQIEIIDLRTLIPWDRQTVLESVSRTSRLLILHEASRTGGFGAEVAAEITEMVFDQLDAPPVRIGAADLPVPFSSTLESDLYSARARLTAGIDRLLSF